MEEGTEVAAAGLGEWGQAEEVVMGMGEGVGWRGPILRGVAPG